MISLADDLKPHSESISKINSMSLCPAYCGIRLIPQNMKTVPNTP